MSQSLVSARWDAEYRKGRYAGEPPLPFVEKILAGIRASSLAERRGLYIGCGNRSELSSARTIGTSSLRTGSVRRSASPVGRSGACAVYALDLRRLPDVRQPMPLQPTSSRFRCSSTVLPRMSPGTSRESGPFCLPVASSSSGSTAASTQVRRPHTVIERNDSGGFTIRYDSGPKQGLPVHFFSRDELHTLTRDDFALVGEPREDVTVRKPSETGHWVQWEAIWERPNGESAWRGGRDGP